MGKTNKGVWWRLASESIFCVLTSGLALNRQRYRGLSGPDQCVVLTFTDPSLTQLQSLLQGALRTRNSVKSLSERQTSLLAGVRAFPFLSPRQRSSGNYSWDSSLKSSSLKSKERAQVFLYNVFSPIRMVTIPLKGQQLHFITLCLFIYKQNPGAWRDGSVAKGKYCVLRGPTLDAQHSGQAHSCS